jgi:hypothetical protein
MTIDVLLQDEQGYCKLVNIAVSDDGEPDSYYGVADSGAAKILGWGKLDGPARRYQSVSAGWSLLVPTRNRLG